MMNEEYWHALLLLFGRRMALNLHLVKYSYQSLQEEVVIIFLALSGAPEPLFLISSSC
jgi:hypothetical protein